MSFEHTTVRTITQAGSLKQFVSPQEMLQRLIQAQIPQCECEQSNEQQVMLQKLIEEYKVEIAMRAQEIADAESLILRRDHLYIELENLRNERGIMEQNIASQLNYLQNEHQMRMTGLRSQTGGVGEEAQLIQIRESNNKMRIRLKDLLDYIARMEAYNQKLEMSRTVLPPRVQHAHDRVYERAVINERQVLSRLAQQDDYTRKMEERVRRMQEESINHVKIQQEQIRQRNLARVSQMRMNQQLNTRTTYTPSYQQPVLGNSRGNYQNGVYFPDRTLYDRLA